MSTIQQLLSLEKRLISLAVGVLMTAASSAAANAQSLNTVRVMPEVVVVDPKTHTATVKFANLSGDTTTIKITTQYAAPRSPSDSASDSIKVDSLQGDSAAADSLKKVWSLGEWIKDLPTQLTLAPHSAKTVTLHLTMPPSLQPGEYSTHILATIQHQSDGPVRPSNNNVVIDLGGGGSQKMNGNMGQLIQALFGGGKGGIAVSQRPSASKLVYRVNGKSAGASPQN